MICDVPKMQSYVLKCTSQIMTIILNNLQLVHMTKFAQKMYKVFWTIFLHVSFKFFS